MYILSDEKTMDNNVLSSHVFLVREPSSGRFSFHNLYRLFLQEKEYLLTEEERTDVWQKAAAYYASHGDTIEAIACYRKSKDHIGMLKAITDFAVSQPSVTGDVATFLLEHLNLLTKKEVEENPSADIVRAFIYLHAYMLEEAEAILLNVEQKLLLQDTVENKTLLGNVYALIGLAHMMRLEDDFANFYKRATTYLQGNAYYLSKNRLKVHNNHSFLMPNNLPGAKEKMEQAMHEGVPLMAQLMDGAMSGMQYIFSAEQAYLTFQFDEAINHVHRGIYVAEINTQHDLVCNGYFGLARVAFMQGDFQEMTRQVQNIETYAAKYEIPVLNEIRDTVWGWYYVSLKDFSHIPKNITDLNHANLTALTYGRPQIVYANYLINIGEYARVVAMLEQSKLSFSINGIWHDGIVLNIMLAVGYYHLGNITLAMRVFWETYDMCYNNGLVTSFVEAEEHMCLLIEAARKETVYLFDASWLDEIEEQTRAHMKRAASVRSLYKKKDKIGRQEKSPLTARELDVLQDMALGLTREEIATKQFVSVNTVKTFIRNIYTKLNAANRAEAIAIAISKEYLDITYE